MSQLYNSAAMLNIGVAFYPCEKWKWLRGSANHWNQFGAGGHLQDILRIHIEKHKYIQFSKSSCILRSMCVLLIYESVSPPWEVFWAGPGPVHCCSPGFHCYCSLKLLPFLRLLEDICGCFSVRWPIFNNFLKMFHFYSLPSNNLSLSITLETAHTQVIENKLQAFAVHLLEHTDEYFWHHEGTNIVYLANYLSWSRNDPPTLEVEPKAMMIM